MLQPYETLTFSYNGSQIDITDSGNPPVQTQAQGVLHPHPHSQHHGGAAAVRRRGNLLLTAIFIAVFLFFLFTALVSTNREDVLYASPPIIACKPTWRRTAPSTSPCRRCAPTRTGSAPSATPAAHWPAARKERRGAADARSDRQHHLPSADHRHRRRRGTTQNEAMTVEEFRMAASVPSGQEAMFFTMSTSGDLLDDGPHFQLDRPGRRAAPGCLAGRQRRAALHAGTEGNRIRRPM